MTKEPAEKYKLIFGSNIIENCSHIISIEGSGVNKEIIRFRIGGDGKLLMNCTVKDPNNKTIAKVHNSKFVHIDEAFEGSILENVLLVRHKETKDIYLEFRYIGPYEVKVNGIFSVLGKKIVATDNGLWINGLQLKNNTFSSCEAAIGLS